VRRRNIAVLGWLVVVSTLAPSADAPAAQRSANRLVAEVPIETAFGGVAFFQGRVNSSGPFRFLLDTGGAGSSLKLETAENLGIKLERGQATVAGNSALDVSVIRRATINVGAAEFPADNMMAAPLAPLEPIFGRRIDGILGGDWIRNFVVELDYEKKLMRLYSPDNFKYEGRGEALPLAVIHGIPFVDLEVTLPNGRSLWGHFLVDTGGGGMAVHIHKKIDERDALSEGLRRASETGIGIGGAAQRYAVRGEELQIGKFKLKRPPVVITGDEAGLRADPSSVGLVGMEVLRRFKVTFDYSRARMYLEPNANFRDAFVYNATGLGLRAVPPDFSIITVSSVRDDSPAKEAGILRGDVLVEIGSQATAGLTLEGIRVMLRSPGQSLRLVVLRDGKPLELALHMKELLP
jgi:predicted aspartyl protease